MFKDNIDAPSNADKRDLDNMVEEGKRLGLDPEDLGVGEKGDETFGQQPKDAFKPNNEDDESGEETVTPKPEADKEEDESDEDESTDESEDGQDEGQPSTDSKKYITKGEFGKFSRDIRRGFKDLSSSITKLAEAKTPAEKKEAQEDVAAEVDDFMTYAQKYKDAEGNPMNADALKELGDIIEKQVLGKIPLDQIKGLTDLSPVVSKMSDDMSREEIISEFNTEWQKDGLKLAKTQYPNATDDQIAKAQAKMFELATSEKYGQVEGKHDAYPMDYILMKEAEVFKDILYSPRKKTAESSQLGDDFSDEDEGASDQGVLSTRFEDMTPKRAAQMEDALGKADGDDFY